MSDEYSAYKQQVFGIVGIILILFLCYKLLLPYYAHSQFKIDVQQICNWDRENSIQPPAPDVISARVVKAAHKRSIPLDKRRIKIETVGTAISITVKYSVPIDLIVKSFDWVFRFKVKTQDMY